jgi:hypothetical protein
MTADEWRSWMATQYEWRRKHEELLNAQLDEAVSVYEGVGLTRNEAEAAYLQALYRQDEAAAEEDTE